MGQSKTLSSARVNRATSTRSPGRNETLST